MKSIPGTYVLALKSHSEDAVRIGRWGITGVEPGYYIYVGSALGPGGVRSRVARHWRSDKAKHWHIGNAHQPGHSVAAASPTFMEQLVVDTWTSHNTIAFLVQFTNSGTKQNILLRPGSQWTTSPTVESAVDRLEGIDHLIDWLDDV